MLPSKNFAIATLLGTCLALAGCSNPAIAPEAPKLNVPVAGSGGVSQPQSPAASGGGAAPVIPAVSIAGSAALAAGSGGVISAAAGGGAATAGSAAGAGGVLAGSGGAGAAGAAGTAAGSGGSAGAGGSDADDWLPIIGDDDMDNPSQPAANSCSDLFCFDVLDCAIFHPDEAATCNFTACEDFVCK